MLRKCPKCGKTRMFVNKEGKGKCYACGFKGNISEVNEMGLIKKNIEKKEEYEEEEGYEETDDDSDENIRGYDKEIETIRKKMPGRSEAVPVKKEIEDIWSVQRVPTEYGLAIVNAETGEAIDVLTAVSRIMNDMEYMKKVLR